MSQLLGDLRQALRATARRPGVAVVAVVTLAVGIGANAAIFTVVNAVLLRPLPYREADRLVAVFAHETRRGERRNPTSPADFLEWRKESRALEAVTAAHPWSPVLTGRGRPEELRALKASPGLFDLLGVEPALGRGFRARDAEAQVVLSHGLWQRLFGADPGLIGRSLTLDGGAYVVVGVMPRDFRFPPFWATGAELWTPLVFTAEEEASRARFLRVFGRLRAGATLAQAQAELDVVARRLEADRPESNAGVRVSVEALQEPVVSRVRPALLVLSGAVGFVLLIACANVTSLLLAQGLSREREAAIRSALGAGRGRLARQWLAESVVLALAGGLGGLALARSAVALLRALGPERLPRLEEIALDARVVGFTLLVSLATGLLSGLGPALRAGRADVTASLQQGERVASGRGRHRVHDLLVVVEFALAVVLLVGSGLLMRSFLLLQRPQMGFRTDRLLTLTLSLSGSPWAEAARRPAFFRELGESVRAVPGVEGAGFVNHLPVAGDTWQTGFTIESRPAPDSGEVPRAVMRTVTPDYLGTMGIPLLRGRTLAPTESAEAPRAVLVNRALARRYWPQADPVASRIRLGGRDSDRPWMTVVGVVGDARQGSLTEPIQPELIFPYAQDPVGWFKGTTLVVRTAVEPRTVAEAVKARVWSLGPDLPVTQVRTMEEILAEAVVQERFNTLLLGLLAGVGLLLAAVGVYGVTAYSVGRRTHEIGVRMALGARAAEVFVMIIGHGLRLGVLGAGLGLLGALSLSRVLQGMIHGVSPTDPWTPLAVTLLLTAVAALACLLPALWAARVDPLVALREP